MLDKQAPSVRSVRPDIPADLDAIIQRCLQKSPGGRFAGYDSLREALLPLSSMKPTPASPGNRLLANIADVITMSVVVSALMFGWQWIAYGKFTVMLRFAPELAIFNVLFTLFMISIVFLYYALTEWRFGKTFGVDKFKFKKASFDNIVLNDEVISETNVAPSPTTVNRPQ